MFNDLNKQASPNTSVDDIFAETDAATHPAGSKVNIEAQAAGLSAQAYSGSGTEQATEHAGAKLKFILILALAVVILAAAAYLVYAKMTRNTSDIIDNNLAANIPAASEKPIVNPNNSAGSVGTVVAPEVDIVESSGTIVVPETVPDLVDPSTIIATETQIIVAPVDSDGDSLTDAEEVTFGTNINLIDSDFDGLSDYEELKVYGTNPLNPDTDGDGYTDGDEVKNGYSPKGEGKL